MFLKIQWEKNEIRNPKNLFPDTPSWRAPRELAYIQYHPSRVPRHTPEDPHNDAQRCKGCNPQGSSGILPWKSLKSKNRENNFPNSNHSLESWKSKDSAWNKSPSKNKKIQPLPYQHPLKNMYTLENKHVSPKKGANSQGKDCRPSTIVQETY